MLRARWHAVNPQRTLVSRCAALVSVLAAVSPATPRAQNAILLEPGPAIERPLSGDQSHAYRLLLTAGDFVHITIRKQGVDLTATLVGPDGRELSSRHTDGSDFSDEVVVAIAEAGGGYTLLVHSTSPSRPASRYTIEVTARRPASAPDRVRIEAETAVQRASSLEETGQPKADAEAIDLFRAALERFRALGDRRREMRALIGIAGVQADLSRPETLDTAQQAERLARDMGDESVRARAVHVIGMALERRGDLIPALRAHEEATAISRVLGDRKYESTTLNSEGIVHGRMGESEQAVARFEQALSLARAVPYRLVELSALGNLGVAYKNLGEFDKASDAYRGALAEFRNRNDVDRQALVLNNMGNLEHLLDHDQKALTLHLDALALARQSGGKDNEARSLNTIGMTYTALGDYEKALDYHRQSLEIRRETGDLLGQGASLGGEGRAWLRLGESDRALTALHESLAIRRSILDRGGELDTLRDLAIVERDRGNVTEALADIRAAVELEETLRGRVTSPALRSSFAAFQHDKYELLIDLLQQQHRADASGGRDAEALHVAERARARVLLESLLDGHVDLRRGIEPALLERERTLQKQLNDASAQLSRALASKGAATPSDDAARRVDQLTDNYQRLQSEIRRQSPSYAAITQPDALTAVEIQRTVVDDDTVLLEFALGDERSWLWAVTPRAIVSVELPSRREIDTRARSLYQRFIARQRQRGESNTGYAERVRAADGALVKEAAALSQMLFGGIASRLNGDWRGKRLAIVAGGTLEYLPFAALPVPDRLDGYGQTAAAHRRQSVSLVQRHEIVSVPSASVLAVLRRDTSDRTPAPRTLAILADPVFEDADPRVNAVSLQRTSSSRASAPPSSVDPGERARRAGLARLSFSREEADAIASLASPGAVFEATDFKASRATALDGTLSGYRLVHFATHGVLDSERPSLSGLVLSLIDGGGAPQNGYVRLHDIYNLRLDADLVVLSACQTALGKEVRGEGLVGLARAFMYAGAPRVVASLWEVSDRATAELMKTFYAGMLQRRLRPAAALRAAQLEMSRDPRWSSPYYWAGFVLQGEWR